MKCLYLDIISYLWQKNSVYS